jgi:pimeloyl-ACP methyl ester carboxylesterase
MIAVNGIELFLREQGDGPLVLLCHGWPELSYSWRHQIEALAAAGFRDAAPDMRGFGQSSAPPDISAYSIFDSVGDMVALVAALGASKAAIVAHDWGAPVAWHAALFRPDLFSAAAGLSVPPPVRGRGRPLDTLRANGVSDFYWQYFQTPGVAEAELERDVALSMRNILGRGFLRSARLALHRCRQGVPARRTCRSAAAELAQQGRSGVFRRHLPPDGFPRRPELVPQHRSQLGSDGALAGPRRSASPRCSSQVRRIPSSPA